MTTTTDPDELLLSATRGFDYLFANDLVRAKAHFAGKDDPFHLLGEGVCAFLEAALGMETGLMTEATRCLTQSEAGARSHMKAPKDRSRKRRFPPGLEWEILNADAVILLGLTNALSESYMGYLQCMYALNSAHSKFSKLYKTVFPHGLDAYDTPAGSRAPSRKSSSPSMHSAPSTPTTSNPAPSRSLFARLTGSASSSTATLSVPNLHTVTSANGTAGGGDQLPPDGPVEELVVAGTAFGYGLFNLVFSLLPKKVQGIVGFLGFKHDRQLALRALAVSAQKKDVHSVFAGLVLMTYYGVVLLLSGFQADEQHIIKQYKAIVDSIESRYPEGALWILNRAKILRMSYDPEGAIQVLREGLRPDRPHSFAQADTLLVFELAWTLLGQRRYQEAADMFIKVTELNSWSHGTYYFLAAGCYISLGNTSKAQALLDQVPELIEQRKISGKDLPTEVLIKKKLEFYKEKQKRRGGDEKLYAQCIKISIAEELGLFWNTHARIERRLALKHIRDLSALTPVVSVSIANAATPTPTPLSPLPRPHRTPQAVFGFSHDLRPMPSSAHHRSSSSHSTPRNSASIDSTRSTATGPVEGNPNGLPDLDTPDELAVRHLLVGVCERTAGQYEEARTNLKAACALHSQVRVSTWVGGVAMFELAVLDLKEVEAKEEEARFNGSVGNGAGVHEAVKRLTQWDKATKSAGKKLDAAMALAGSSVDLSSRLDSRVSMLRDEIAGKREALGI
ncbi:putative protein of unknown function (DUF3808) [Lyophyllum shimeji]|uniref:Mitochondrial outer membrane protein IML2 n=1 Tax=Lyophyllum shimeji TaxID=47721 RepID=A0A9P3PMW9_LYOSH|nr:putative protein of unknown function (DUF3808) [Lyophyllum shimeji]